VEAEWGQQVRNYVFHPYEMVKDVRTGWWAREVHPGAPEVEGRAAGGAEGRGNE